jgi:hypothetical protein
VDPIVVNEFMKYQKCESIKKTTYKKITSFSKSCKCVIGFNNIKIISTFLNYNALAIVCDKYFQANGVLITYTKCSKWSFNDHPCLLICLMEVNMLVSTEDHFAWKWVELDDKTSLIFETFMRYNIKCVSPYKKQ